MVDCGIVDRVGSSLQELQEEVEKERGGGEGRCGRWGQEVGEI